LGKGEGAEEGGAVVAYTKGAPEHVLPLCHDRLGSDGVLPLDRATVEEVVERMAAEGLRVLAVAMRRWPTLPEPLDAENIETRLTFVGLVGLMDPPRAEARGGAALPQRRHHAGHDHRRSPGDGARHRRAPGHHRR
jgi:Ca2+-transporting ATPase